MGMAHNPADRSFAAPTPMALKLLIIGVFLHPHLFESFMVVLMSSGFYSQKFTIGFRLAVLCFSFVSLCLFLVYGKNNNGGLKSNIYSGKVWAPLMMFWGLYFLRITHDIFFNASVLEYEGPYYMKLAFGVCFFPMLLYFIRLRPQDMVYALWSYTAGLIMTGALMAVGYRFLFGTGFGRIGSYAGDLVVSPHAVAYTGSSLIMISYYMMFYYKPKTYNMKLARFAVLIFSLVAGAICLGLGASRGPIVSVIVASIFLILIEAYKKNALHSAIFLVCNIIGVLILSGLLDIMGSNVGDRIASTSIHEGRISLITEAFMEFIEHPILGSAVVLPRLGSYPHNLIAESFMAVGIVGGVCFTGFLIFTVRKAVLIVIRMPEYSWISLIFINHAVHGMFSSALYNLSPFWYFAGAVLAVHIPDRAERNDMQKPPTRPPPSHLRIPGGRFRQPSGRR